MREIKIIDLHGVRHNDVTPLLSNKFFWENVYEAEIITGGSIIMKEIVREWLDTHKMNYVEYLRKDSFLVLQ